MRLTGLPDQMCCQHLSAVISQSLDPIAGGVLRPRYLGQRESTRERRQTTHKGRVFQRRFLPPDDRGLAVRRKIESLQMRSCGIEPMTVVVARFLVPHQKRLQKRCLLVWQALEREWEVSLQIPAFRCRGFDRAGRRRSNPRPFLLRFRRSRRRNRRPEPATGPASRHRGGASRIHPCRATEV